MRIIESLEALEPTSCSDNMLRELMTATEEFDLVRQELAGLYKQDKRGVYERQAFLTGENTILQLADQLISKIKNAQKSDKLSETMSVPSRDSRRSRASRASTSSSVIRMRALVEAAAAKEQAEYDRLMAEKENELRQREAEEEKQRQQARARHEMGRRYHICGQKGCCGERETKGNSGVLRRKRIKRPHSSPRYGNYRMPRKNHDMA